jgi:hypothetical protein
MDDKTEQLRDIFMDVAEEGTVTERQADQRGSLRGADESDVDERLAGVVADMRERFTFETDLDDETYCRVVRGFYEGVDDANLADSLGLDPETVFRARMDLQLFDDADEDAPLDMSTLRDRVAEGADAEALAEQFETDRETVERYCRVAAAQNAARRTSYRFRTAFEDILTDADLSVQHTAGVREDGLDDATEDIETNLSF